jgi:hypothetical protein
MFPAEAGFALPNLTHKVYRNKLKDRHPSYGHAVLDFMIHRCLC